MEALAFEVFRRRARATNATAERRFRRRSRAELDATRRETEERCGRARAFARTLAHGHGNRRLEATDARHRVLGRDATHAPDALRLHGHHHVRGHVKSRHRAFETDESRPRVFVELRVLRVSREWRRAGAHARDTARETREMRREALSIFFVIMGRE